MPKRPDRLAKDFVDAALELHRRRLWNELPGDAVFLVRVPTEDLPVAANVMGQEGREFGLGLSRGEGALRRMVGMYGDTGDIEELMEAGDLLSVSFEAWAAVSDPFRRLVQAAGLQPRRDRVVPIALARPPYEIARPAGRGDLRTLLSIVRGVLAAHDAGELRPIPLLDGDGTPAEVLEIEVAGEPREPVVTTRLVPWPKDAGELDLPPLVALPGDLARLPKHDERWLLGRFPLAAEIEEDERAVFAVFVAEDEDGLVLSQGIAMGDEVAPVAEILTRAFREPLGEPRLPEEIVFDSPRFHHAFAPALAGLGVDAVLDPECPELLELSEELAYALADPDLGESEEPEALQAWRAVADRATTELVEDILNGDRITPRAMNRYFGSESEGEDVLDELAPLGPNVAFVEWLLADYRPTKRSKTMLEKELARKHLDPAERVVLESRRDARLSIFRVDSSEPGATVDVEDVLTGERFTLHDPALSGCDLDGVFLLMRLCHVEDWVLPMIAGPPLSALEVDDALAQLERAGAELSPEGLRRDAHLVGRLWPWFRMRRMEDPVLENTDGDPLELQTATFRLADPAAVARVLDSRDDLRVDESEGEWVWLRDGGPPGAGSDTVLGQLEILDDRLVLEVNSAARLERARAWLEAIPGVRFERSTTHVLDHGELPLDDRLPEPLGEPTSSETIELLQTFALDHYRRWLDERVPMLDDLTPREACATPDGRRRVERLLRTLPPIGTPNGPIEVPRDELLRELGIPPGR